MVKKGMRSSSFGVNLQLLNHKKKNHEIKYEKVKIKAEGKMKMKMNQKQEKQEKLKNTSFQLQRCSNLNTSFQLQRCSNLNKKLLIKRKKSTQGSSSSSSCNDAVFDTEKDNLLKSDELLRRSRRRKKRKQKPQPQPQEEEEEDINNIIRVKRGDRINLRPLLFPKHRDFLLKSNSNRLVKAEELEGKVIVLFFAYLFGDVWEKYSFDLTEVYKEIHHKFPFEVVFVPLTRPDYEKYPNYFDPRYDFTHVFSSMPWTAVPYSDVTSWQRLRTTFGFTAGIRPDSVVIDPTGLVLATRASYFFSSFGPRAYPFTTQRFEFLISEQNDLLKHPSITKLLTSPERDYVISNDGLQVPIHSLEDKVVALHFIEEGEYGNSGQYLYQGGSWHDLTAKLMSAYEQLVKNKNFEVVLIYIHDSLNTYHCTNEDKFWKKFKTMPWLALPFKDPIIKKLKRMCRYPLDLEGPAPNPGLVIVGPRGEFFEPYGADILMNFGIEAYPFSRRRLVDFEAGKATFLKLDMLWDSNTVLKRRDESRVQFSQVAGKRIILLIGSDWAREYAESLTILKSNYDQMKDTDDEFEVIQILDTEELFDHNEHAADVPWLVHPTFDEGSLQQRLLVRAFGDARLVAFDCDGQVVRRAEYPTFDAGEDSKFPFSVFAGDLEKGIYSDLYLRFEWGYWGEDAIFHM